MRTITRICILSALGISFLWHIDTARQLRELRDQQEDSLPIVLDLTDPATDHEHELRERILQALDPYGASRDEQDFWEANEVY